MTCQAWGDGATQVIEALPAVGTPRRRRRRLHPAPPGDRGRPPPGSRTCVSAAPDGCWRHWYPRCFAQPTARPGRHSLPGDHPVRRTAPAPAGCGCHLPADVWRRIPRGVFHRANVDPAGPAPSWGVPARGRAGQRRAAGLAAAHDALTALPGSGSGRGRGQRSGRSATPTFPLDRGLPHRQRWWLTLIGRPVDDARHGRLLEPVRPTGTAVRLLRSAAWLSNCAAAPVYRYSTSPICDGAGPAVAGRLPARYTCS